MSNLQTLGSRLVIENLDGYLTGTVRASGVTDDFADRLRTLSQQRVSIDDSGLSTYQSNIAQSVEKTGVFGSSLSATQVIGIGALAAIGAEAVKLTARLVELGAKSVIKFAAEGFESAESAQQTIADIAAQSGASQEQITQLNETLRAVSLNPQLKVGYDEAGQAVSQLLDLGLQLPTILGGGLQQVVLLQNSIGGSFAENGELFAKAVKQFHIPESEFGNLTNALTALRRSGLDVTDINNLLSAGGGPTGTITSFQDFFKAAALARPAFASGADLGTSFKSLEARLADPPKELREALKQYGLNFFDATSGSFVGFEKIQQQLFRVLSNPVQFTQVTGGRTGAQQAEFERLTKELARKQQELSDVNTGVKSFLSDDAKNKRIHVLEDEIRHTQDLLGPLQGIQGVSSTISRQLTDKEKLNLAKALGGTDALRLILQLGGATQQQVEDLNKLFSTTSAADSAATRTATFQAKLETLEDVLAQLGRDAASPLLAPLTPAIEDLTTLAGLAGPSIQTLGENIASYIGPGVDFFDRLTQAISGLSGQEGIILGIGRAISEALDIKPVSNFFDFLFPPDLSSKATGATDGLKKQVESSITDLGAGKGIEINLVPKVDTTKLNEGGRLAGNSRSLNPDSFSDQISTFFGDLQIQLQKGVDGISLTKLTLGDFLAFDPNGVSFVKLGEGVKATLKDGNVSVQLGSFTFDLTAEQQKIQTEIQKIQSTFAEGGIPGVIDLLGTQISEGISSLTRTLFGGPTKQQGRDESPTFEPGLIQSSLEKLPDLIKTEAGKLSDSINLLLEPLKLPIPKLDLKTTVESIETEFQAIHSAFETNGFTGVATLLSSQFGSFVSDFVSQAQSKASELFTSLRLTLFGGEQQQQGKDEAPTQVQGLLSDFLPDLTPITDSIRDRFSTFKETIDSISTTLFGGQAVDASGKKVDVQGLLPSFDLGDLGRKGLDQVQSLFDDVTTTFDRLQSVDTGSISGNLSAAFASILDLFTKFNQLQTADLSSVVGEVSSFIQNLLNAGKELIAPAGPGETSSIGDAATSADAFVASFIDRFTSVLKASDIPGIASSAAQFVSQLISTLADALTVPLDDSGSQVSNGTSSKAGNAVVNLIKTLFDEIEKTITDPNFGQAFGRAGGSIGNLLVSDLLAPLTDALDPAKLQDQAGQGEDLNQNNPFKKFTDNVIKGFLDSFDQTDFSTVGAKFVERMEDAIFAALLPKALTQNPQDLSNLREGTNNLFSDPFLLWKKALGFGGPETAPSETDKATAASVAADANKNYATSAGNAGAANQTLTKKATDASTALDALAQSANGLAPTGAGGTPPPTPTPTPTPDAGAGWSWWNPFSWGGSSSESTSSIPGTPSVSQAPNIVNNTTINNVSNVPSTPLVVNPNVNVASGPLVFSPPESIVSGTGDRESLSADSEKIASAADQLSTASSNFASQLAASTVPPSAQGTSQTINNTTINNDNRATTSTSSTTNQTTQTTQSVLPVGPIQAPSTTGLDSLLQAIGSLIQPITNLGSMLGGLVTAINTDITSLANFKIALGNDQSALVDHTQALDGSTSNLGAFSDALAAFAATYGAVDATQSSTPPPATGTTTNRATPTTGATQRSFLNQNDREAAAPSVKVVVPQAQAPIVNVNVPQQTSPIDPNVLSEIARNTAVSAASKVVSPTGAPIVNIGVPSASGESTPFDPEATGEAVATATKNVLTSTPLLLQIDQSGIVLDLSKISLDQPEWKKIITLQPDWRAILKAQPNWDVIIKDQPAWKEIIRDQPNWVSIITTQPEWTRIINGDVPWESLITPVDLSDFVNGGGSTGGSTGGGGGGGGGGGRAFSLISKASNILTPTADSIARLASSLARATTAEASRIPSILSQPPQTFTSSNSTSFYRSSSVVDNSKTYHVNYSTQQSTNSFARDVRILETLSS